MLLKKTNMLIYYLKNSLISISKFLFHLLIIFHMKNNEIYIDSKNNQPNNIIDMLQNEKTLKYINSYFLILSHYKFLMLFTFNK
jgi:hypothetical protein